MGATSQEAPGNSCADLLGAMQAGVPVPTWMSFGRRFKPCCMVPLRSRFGQGWDTRFAAKPTPRTKPQWLRLHRLGKLLP
eukprot:12923068-Prorocentrum_lima.AAC.1